MFDDPDGSGGRAWGGVMIALGWCFMGLACFAPNHWTTLFLSLTFLIPGWIAWVANKP
jgi:hypothetical protein